ncbi:MAG: propionate--CoA ligase [Myxococcota bacterium]
MSKYYEVWQESLKNPEKFWGKEAEKLHWFKRWDKALDDSRAPFYRWFVGGKTNICYNAIDRHALGARRGHAAIIWESSELGASRVITYYELYREVNAFAGVLKNLGVKKGDRVIIYMPMVSEAAVAMFACARIGAVHCVVFAGFSYEALADRIDDAGADVVICAEAGLRGGKLVDLKRIVDGAIERAKRKVKKVVVLDRGINKEWNKVAERDISWVEAVEQLGEKYIAPVQLESTDPLYILYTSGTTGKPKGVVRDIGGYMVALNTTMDMIYDCREGDVYWSTSDIGWVVGHSYIIYAPLLAGVPSVMYEGTPIHPNPGIWWKLIEKYGITVVFSAPTAFRMLKKFPEEWIKKYDLSSLKYFFLAGEPLDEPTWQWATKVLGKPVIDHYWQTESGWSILANMAGLGMLPIKPGSPTKPVLGYKLEVVDEKGNPLPKNKKGILVSHPPLPPGTFTTIWGSDERYTEYWTQFNGKMLYHSGDYAIEDEDGYFFVLGRADEVINVAGHRLGTREVEEAISAHPAVAEASAIGVSDEVKGEAIAAFVVLKQGFEPNEETKKALIGVVREKIGAIATPQTLEFVRMLPKTRSGKVMRRVLKALCEGKSLGDLTTIEDGASVEEIRHALEGMGVATK